MRKTLPVIVLKSFILLPTQKSKLDVLTNTSNEAINISIKKYNSKVIITSFDDETESHPTKEDIPKTAILASITKSLVLPNGTTRITLEGLKRISIKELYNHHKEKDILLCDYTTISIPKMDENEVIAHKKELKRLYKLYEEGSLNGYNDDYEKIINEDSLDLLTDYIAKYLPLEEKQKRMYLETTNPLKRSYSLIEDLTTSLKLLKLDHLIQKKMEESLDKSQKEYILREKIKEIQKELGEEDNKKSKETEKYRLELEELDISYKTKQKILREITKYELTNEMSPEVSNIRNYLETFFSLPWNEETIEATDLNYVKKELNKSHYGLTKVKERILEYAAMKSRNPMLTSPIICLVGPPGVGKSTIASSIAASLHRTFYKMSVGGLNDSSELIGHRRTYLASSPGKIIQALQKCGSKNPVLLIDEVDKMVRDYKGDPASVLLDILDPNLNQTFTDSYLEEPFDLSHVLFILTANYLQDIPPELRDRLEIIELSSYTTIEKISLAREYLLPSIYEEYHINKDEIIVPDEVIHHIVLYYTKEAGVRDLRRKLETVLRKTIMNSVKKKENLNVTLTIKDIKKYLEETLSLEDLKPKLITKGLVNGLSVTSVGGAVMPIEATMFEGKGRLIMTGSLGDVMKESLSVVLSYLKAHAEEYEINMNVFTKKDAHIHVLEGAIPKNGPSAGVAITTSLISLFTNKIVPKDIAMTGEMTLRGEILPVGGIKEKVIASYNDGIKTVFLPKTNEIDLKIIPKEIKDSMNIILVKEYNDIYKYVFKRG